jgi:hypothetical protein
VPDTAAKFARDLANNLIKYGYFTSCETNNARIEVRRPDRERVSLDLTPVQTDPAQATAEAYFNDVKTVADLIQAYHKCRSEHVFEYKIAEAMRNVSDYADTFLAAIFTYALQVLSDKQAQLVAAWVQNLDVYAAVKSVESLLNSKADLALLELAHANGWEVHFDHLAIRCGSQSNQDAERIVHMLKTHHGYVSSQVVDEAYYQFPDGWNAYPLYKILNNGQFLRLFIDQSDANDQIQIIQHWNRVYGYTAHHLAIRATTQVNGVRKAVLLDELMTALGNQGIEILTPTGQYTAGLLLQVFTKPQVNTGIPDALKYDICLTDAGLGKMINNAKLLELVSRQEMPESFAKRFFALYDLAYDARQSLPSAPVYPYFLPAQAAHVIKTSVQIA